MKAERLAILIATCLAQLNAGAVEIPRLAKQGDATQLLVGGVPFLILGGELGNSTASDLLSLQGVWPKCTSLGLNTVLAPVYWEMVEPKEGEYNFDLVDTLIVQARRHELRLILLWFGSWKNSMSCYVPIWVKTDPDRFPRARDGAGRPMEILSAFFENNWRADASAFRALMRHLRRIDGTGQTVIMVQVENEVGMIPTARDHVDRANELFAGDVPGELVDYLVAHRRELRPELLELWKRGGFRRSGKWEEVFGSGAQTEELFTAWHLARYVNAVAQAGKEEYPLRMFVNAALNRPGHRPGEYPSGGPLPHLLDVWKAAAPAIDIFAPDIYFADFEDWCEKYRHAGNPLFIPEAARGEDAAVHALYAVGQHDALGFSPFSIESIPDPNSHPLRQAYGLLAQLSPLLHEKNAAHQRAGILLSQDRQHVQLRFEQYHLTVSHDFTFKWAKRPENISAWPKVGGLILRIGDDEFVVAGTGIIVTFSLAEECGQVVGIAQIDEGAFVDGRFVPRRRLNGDESHQGRHVRIPFGQFGIQMVRLYRYW